jgi:iron complex transport system substrate-binding protein
VKEGASFSDQPSVLIIHYGRAKNHYLLVTEKSPAAMLVKMAGGTLSMPGEKNMKLLSSELLAQSNPDVILITDYGYDRLAKKNELTTLPGILETNAAKNKRIYRINEFDVMYFGVNSAKQIGILQSLIHQK